MTQLITGSRSGRIVDALREVPDDLTELVAEMRKDPHVQLAERVIRSNAKAATVSFTPKSQDRRAVVLAAILEDRWIKSLANALESYAFGWQAFEVGYAVAGGVQYPNEFVPLPHRAIPADEIDIQNGKVESVTLKMDGSDEKLTLARPYVWVSTIDRTALRPLGSSQFIGAVQEAWRDHKEVRDRRKAFARKHVLGTSIIRAPKYETRSENGVDRQIDVHQEIGQAFSAADGGDFLVLGCDRLVKSDGNEGDYKIEIERNGGECQDASPLIALIDSLSDEILLANGIPPKTLVEGDGVGSFALVTQQMVILMNRVEEILAAVHESYVDFVVKPACKLNFGDSNAISSTFTPIADRPDDLGREIVKAVLTSPQLSPLVLTGAVDVGAMLKAQGIPISRTYEAELAKLRVQQQPTAVGLSLASGPMRGFWG